MVFDHQAFDREHDVGDILLDALDRGELVKRAGQFDLGDGTPFQARKQDPPQAVADRGAKATLERLCRELAVCVGQRVAIGRNTARATPDLASEYACDRSLARSLREYGHLEHNSMIRLACTGIDTSSAPGSRSTRASGIAAVDPRQEVGHIPPKLGKRGMDKLQALGPVFDPHQVARLAPDNSEYRPDDH